MPAEGSKAIAGRWLTEFWGPRYNPDVIDELAAPDVRFEYSMHAPCRGRDQVRAFAARFRAAFPDLGFAGTADLIAEGDYVGPVEGRRHPDRGGVSPAQTVFPQVRNHSADRAARGGWLLPITWVLFPVRGNADVQCRRMMARCNPSGGPVGDPPEGGRQVVLARQRSPVIGLRCRRLLPC
jgi:hypothetical protein